MLDKLNKYFIFTDLAGWTHRVPSMFGLILKDVHCLCLFVGNSYRMGSIVVGASLWDERVILT